jgi:hypothetical protein
LAGTIAHASKDGRAHFVKAICLFAESDNESSSTQDKSGDNARMAWFWKYQKEKSKNASFLVHVCCKCCNLPKICPRQFILVVYPSPNTPAGMLTTFVNTGGSVEEDFSSTESQKKRRRNPPI